MIEIKNNLDFKKETIDKALIKIINQIYRLLPAREEGENWQKPLETIIEELAGINILLERKEEPMFFSLICKLVGLTTLTKEEDFLLYRRVIFDCITMVGKIRGEISNELN